MKLSYFWAILFSFLSLFSGAQSFTQYIEFADEKMMERDYHQALIFYNKAMEFDSNSVEILWKYAEAKRQYKDYVKAEYYYNKVYSKESAKIYPHSIFWLATMQHYNSKYEESLRNWKRAKKVFKKDRKGYEYRKAQQEIKSCLWAKKAILDTADFEVSQLDMPVNTPDAELAPFIYNEQIYYTSLKADSINFAEEVYTTEYTLQIYTADEQDSMFNNVKPLKDVYKKGFHSANGTYSLDGKRFYFSRCNADYACKIYVGNVDGTKITKIDSLGEVINEQNAITTMPHIAEINGEEYLFFSSNREKSQGGLDIWYSKISNGNRYTKPRNCGRSVNTRDNEVSPFYDNQTNKLYFSTSWFPGFGGHDIFYATNLEMKFSDPINLGLPINSPQNDTYYSRHPEREEFYFSSNRYGVNFSKNPTCCNDIFRVKPIKHAVPNRFESLYDLNKRLPVTLYFHNDEPDPNTKDTTTKITYEESYVDYIKLKDKYKNKYSEGLTGDDSEEAREDIDDFFVQYVEQGIIDLGEFTRLLIIELDKGYEIEITVKGFASPLAKTDYNINLTKRRIASLVNYLNIYGSGRFVKYLNGTAENGGGLTFVQIPFGEYTANKLISDNPNEQKKSIYNRQAALERKIEIQSVSLAVKDSSYAEMKFGKEVHDFGESKAGEVLEYKFEYTNTGDKKLVIESAEADCSCTTFEIEKKTLQPDESGIIIVRLNTQDLSGLVVRQVVLKTNLKNEEKVLSVTTEVK